MSENMKTNQIDTPRTEAFCAPERGLGTGYYQALDFARELEREIAELRDEKAAGIRIISKLQSRCEGLQSDLDEIRDLLPDESPCKHEETGCSLYDDIDAIIRQRDGLKKTHDTIFGELYQAGFHSGTVLDKVKHAIGKTTKP